MFNMEKGYRNKIIIIIIIILTTWVHRSRAAGHVAAVRSQDP